MFKIRSEARNWTLFFVFCLFSNNIYLCRVVNIKLVKGRTSMFWVEFHPGCLVRKWKELSEGMLPQEAFKIVGPLKLLLVASVAPEGSYLRYKFDLRFKGVGDLWGNIPPPSPTVWNPNHVIIIIVILFMFSQVVNAEQQIVRKRVKKEYIVPRDSQWTKQWSLVSL